MSRLAELMADFASGDVPIRPLGEIGEFIRGRRFTKADYVESGLGSIHYGEIYTDYGTTASSVNRFVRPELRGSLRLARRGDLVIAATGENVQDVCKAVAWLGADEVAVHDDCYIFRHDMDPTFMAYFFQSARFHDQKARLASESKLARVSGANMAKILVPVPPLEVQEEIVAVLDTFSALEAQLAAELEAELQARRKQFVYYRDALLTFDATDSLSLSLSLSLSARPVRWTTLSEVATIGTGSHDTKDAIPDGPYVFYARGREPLRLDSFDFDERAIVTAGDGVGVGKVFHFADGKYALHQRAYRIVPGEKLDPRYAYHYLVADFARYLEKTSVHASVTSLRRPMFLKYPIPVPPLDEQRRIAVILDQLDALVNELSVGLPAEIAARRTQYEYYRDKLLTFEEAA